MGRRVAITGTVAVILAFAGAVFVAKRGLPRLWRTPQPAAAAAPAAPAPPGRRRR